MSVRRDWPSRLRRCDWTGNIDGLITGCSVGLTKATSFRGFKWPSGINCRNLEWLALGLWDHPELGQKSARKCFILSTNWTIWNSLSWSHNCKLNLTHASPVCVSYRNQSLVLLSNSYANVSIYFNVPVFCKLLK